MHKTFEGMLSVFHSMFPPIKFCFKLSYCGGKTWLKTGNHLPNIP